jgi:hypothetical protein
MAKQITVSQFQWDQLWSYYVAKAQDWFSMNTPVTEEANAKFLQARILFLMKQLKEELEKSKSD